MAIALVSGQVNDNSNDASATTIAVSFPSNVTAGSLLVCGVVCDNAASASVSTVVGSSSGSWTNAINAERVGDQILSCWYKENAAGGADTITATYNASHTFRRMIIAEYSGAATSSALDKTSSNLQEPASTSTDAATSGSQTTTTNNQLIVGFIHVLAGGSITITAGTNFTKRDDTTNAAQLAMEDRILATAGSVAATFTLGTSQNTLTAMMTFSETSIGGGGSRPMFRGS